MGGSLGGAFSGQGQGANGGGSFLQNLIQGTTKGALTAAGNGLQKQPTPPNGGTPPSPAPTPVDPRFFQPTAAPAPAGGGYGGSPSSAFYG
jgi:hypothetical protein